MPKEPPRRARASVRRFDRWAPSYDRGLAARLFFKPLHRRLRMVARLRPGDRVLDVGAGTGALVAAMRQDGIQAYGADPSVGMLRVAHRKSPNRFIVAAAEALPFREGSFDLVVTSVSMHHWSSPERGLAEMGRVAAPNGRVLVADHESRGLLGAFIAIRHARPGGGRLLGREEIVRGMNAVGLKVIAQRKERCGILVTVARRP